jgi:hypothetical protein
MWGPVFVEDIVITHQMCMRFFIFMAGVVSDPKQFGRSENYCACEKLHVGYFMGAT